MKSTTYLTFLFLLLFFSVNYLFSQVGIGTTNPNPGAALEIKSTDGAILVPKMTKLQRDAIDVTTNPDGLLIYQTDNNPGFYFYKAGAWRGFSVDRPVLVPKMVIPRCHKIIGMDTGNKLQGSFTTTIDGVLTTVSWKMFWNKRVTQSNSTVNINGNTVIRAPAVSQKIEVIYEFSPPLPFLPKSIMFTSYDDVSSNSYPDTFLVSILKIVSTSKLKINISRTDIYGDDSTDCWHGENFKFDALIIE